MHSAYIHILFSQQGRQLADVKLGRAEKKILVILCYYTLYKFTSSTLGVYYGQKIEQFFEELKVYFWCASMNGDCNPPQLQKTFHPVGVALAWLLPACLPLFLLAYVVDCQRFKKFIKKREEAPNSSHPTHIRSQIAKTTSQNA